MDEIRFEDREAQGKVMNMKRLVAVLLSVALVASAGCSKEETSDKAAKDRSLKSDVTGTEEEASDRKDSEASGDSDSSDPDVSSDGSESDTDTSSGSTTSAPNPPAGAVAINEENFPDSVFRAYISENLDLNADGFMDEEEICEVTKLNFNAEDEEGLTSLKGVEYFTALTSLSYRGEESSQESLQELDVSQNTELIEIWITNTQITTLDVSANTKLEELWCYDGKLEKVIFGDNPELWRIRVSGNPLKELDLSQCPALKMFVCFETNIQSLDLSHNPKLNTLSCGSTPLKALDLSVCPELESLFVDQCLLENLDLNGCPLLRTLSCKECGLTSLDVSMCPELDVLYCDGNQLTELDLSANTRMVILTCNGNQLTTLDLEKMELPIGVECANNLLTEIRVPKSIVNLDCTNNQITRLDFKNTDINGLICCGNPLTSLSFGEFTSLLLLDVRDTQLVSVDIRNCSGLVETMQKCERKEMTEDGTDVTGTGKDFDYYEVSGYVVEFDVLTSVLFCEGTEIVWK